MHAWAVERSVRIGVLPGMTERPRVQIPPGPPDGRESVKDFFCFDIPPGGREKDNRKIIVNRKRKDNEKKGSRAFRDILESIVVSKSTLAS